MCQLSHRRRRAVSFRLPGVPKGRSDCVRGPRWYRPPEHGARGSGAPGRVVSHGVGGPPSAATPATRRWRSGRHTGSPAPCPSRTRWRSSRKPSGERWGVEDEAHNVRGGLCRQRPAGGRRGPLRTARGPRPARRAPCPAAVGEGGPAASASWACDGLNATTSRAGSPRPRTAGRRQITVRADAHIGPTAAGRAPRRAFSVLSTLWNSSIPVSSSYAPRAVAASVRNSGVLSAPDAQNSAPGQASRSAPMPL